MRRRRRRHRRYNNHIWVFSVIASLCLLTMGVGYAILSAENNIQIDVTKTEAPVPVEEKITGLIGSSTSVASGSGTLEKITHSGVSQTNSKTSYRYRGANPNNYVKFNDELWRIIGIVDGKVKLIRNKSIGNYSWDNKNTSTGAESDYGKNEWTDSRLMMLLNPQSDGTSYTGDGGSLYWDSESGNCYSGQNNATTACDFTSTGLSSAAKTMIEKSTWYLGGWNTSQIRTNVMYEKERGNTVYSGRSTSWKGYVGLMYPSDYGYAASSSCSNSYNLYDYDNSTCKNNNWLFKNDSTYYWTLAPYSGDSGRAFIVYSDGHVNDHSHRVSTANGVRPVLYLKSGVMISGGEGTQASPYTLAL